MKHKDGLDIAALLLLLLVAIVAMVVPVALTQPALLAVPAVLVLITLCVVLYQRRRLRAFLARQLCSTDFENSRIQYSLANLPIPTVLVNDGRILWYNQYFRQDVLNDYDAVTRPVNRVLPELDLAVCSRPHGQDLKVGERRFTAYAGSAKGSRGANIVYLVDDTVYKQTLEEYTAALGAYSAGSPRRLPDGTRIYVVPAGEEETVIPLPEQGCAEISGNNADGFVVTVRPS